MIRPVTGAHAAEGLDLQAPIDPAMRTIAQMIAGALFMGILLTLH
jgi:hypothetical protein